MNILFLCTGNSCRSILAEATFKHLAPAGWHAMSAGSHPTGTVHTRVLTLLAREGIATAGFSSKSWDNLPQTPDIVVTVCANAAGETCPAYLGPVLRTHWGVEDPAHFSGTDAEIDAAFMTTYKILLARIEAFLALPLHDLQNDSPRLKAELDRIGTLMPTSIKPSTKETPVKKIQVFDPALCCSSGVCGSDVDQKLIDFSADVDWAKQHGADIERFNLARQPMVFAENAAVKGLLERSGESVLPITLVDGEVAFAGRYPSRDDLARWLGVMAPATEPAAVASSNACCGGGKCCG